MNNASFARLVFVSSLALVAAVTLTFLSFASPSAVRAEGGCTLNTLKGTYLFQAHGVVVEDGEALPYAEAGMWTLDGKGHATGVLSASIDGAPFATRDAFNATYRHTAGCVFTAEDAFGLTFDLYTTPSSRTITYFSDGFSGTMVKQ